MGVNLHKIKKMCRVIFCTLFWMLPFGAFCQKTYMFSYDLHGNRVARTYKQNNEIGSEMTAEELGKHFVLRGVAKNVKFLQFIDIDIANFQWIFVYDPNGMLCLYPERYESGCLINLQNVKIKGLYVVSFCYNNYIYSYKITVI